MPKTNTTTKHYTISAFREQIKDIGQRIKTARQARGLTQGDLAELVQTSSKTVSSLEVGRVEPSVSQLMALSAVLQEPIGYFVGEDSSSVVSKFDRVAGELAEIRKLMDIIEHRNNH